MQLLFNLYIAEYKKKKFCIEHDRFSLTHSIYKDFSFRNILKN